MAGKQNAPEIRFEGFTGPWEQRKLGELVSEISTGRSVNSDDSIRGVPGNQEGAFVLKTSCVSSDRFDPSERKKVVADETSLVSCPAVADAIIVSRMNTPERVGACGYVFSSCENTYLPDRLWRLMISEGVLPYVVYLSLIQPGVRQRVKGMSTGTSGSMHNIPQKSFLGLWMSIPSTLPEQRAIGAFFRELDDLIALHQRKYDKLCTVKKSMLDKMFPKPGETEPEIRFEGFTDPWEQRKLGEIFEEYSEKNRADLPPLTIIQGGGTVYRDESNRNLQFDKNSLSNYKAVNPDDFIVHLRSFEGGLEKATYCGLISPAYHTFHGDGIDSDFYYLYFRSKRFIDTDLKPHVYGIRDGRSIDIDGMKTIPIPWTTVDEQRAIGGFYNSLDSLITLHQRKLELLRNIKKSLLDRMFV